MRDGKPSLTWPLLDPDGFLADPEIAAILTRALTGGYLEGAPVLGRAWARAFLDGTRADEAHRGRREPARLSCGSRRRSCGCSRTSPGRASAGGPPLLAAPPLRPPGGSARAPGAHHREGTAPTALCERAGSSPTSTGSLPATFGRSGA